MEDYNNRIWDSDVFVNRLVQSRLLNWHLNLLRNRRLRWWCIIHIQKIINLFGFGRNSTLNHALRLY